LKIIRGGHHDRVQVAFLRRSFRLGPIPHLPLRRIRRQQRARWNFVAKKRPLIPFVQRLKIEFSYCPNAHLKRAVGSQARACARICTKVRPESNTPSHSRTVPTPTPASPQVKMVPAATWVFMPKASRHVTPLGAEPDGSKQVFLMPVGRLPTDRKRHYRQNKAVAFPRTSCQNRAKSPKIQLKQIALGAFQADGFRDQKVGRLT
jgi:hypothetical protein